MFLVCHASPLMLIHFAALAPRRKPEEKRAWNHPWHIRGGEALWEELTLSSNQWFPLAFIVYSIIFIFNFFFQNNSKKMHKKLKNYLYLFM